MPPVPVWHRDYRPRERKDVVLNGGSRQNRLAVEYRTLQSMVEAGSLSQQFIDARTYDRDAASAFPVRGDGLLDFARLERAVGEDPRLYTIVHFRHLMCKSYDLAISLAGLGDQHLCRGDYAKVDMSRLVGRLMPIMSTSPKPFGTKGSDKTERMFDALDAAKPHCFHGRLCVLATNADVYKKHDEGEARALCVIVSPRLFNHTAGDARLSFGAELHPAFQETLYYVLVLHAYPGGGVAYNDLNCKKAGEQPYDAVFKWSAWRSNHEAEGGKLNNNRLSQTKMTGSDVTRAIVGSRKRVRDDGATDVIAGVRSVRRRLAELRGDGTLDIWLRENPMHSKNELLEDGMEGGMRLRCMLLTEIFLCDTPAESLLSEGGTLSIPGQPPAVPAPKDIKTHADRLFGSPQPPPQPPPRPVDTCPPCPPSLGCILPVV